MLSIRLGMKEHKLDLLDKMNTMIQAWEMGKGKDGWVWKDNWYNGYTTITGMTSLSNMYQQYFNPVKDLWMKERRGHKVYYKPIDDWTTYFDESIIEEGMNKLSTLDIIYRDFKIIETIIDLVDEHNHNLTLMNKLYADETYSGMVNDLINLVNSIKINTDIGSEMK